MTSKNQEVENNTNNALSVLAGIFVGGLAGAATMMLLAPQSGKETRARIQEKSIELRDQTSEMMEDAMVQMRSGRKQLARDGRHKVKELVEHGQAMVVEQLEHVSDAAKAGQKAVQAL